MKNFRLNRIFNDKSGRFLGVALEEPFFAERDIFSALDSVRAILSDGSDVLQVDEEQGLLVQATPGAPRRSLILEVDPFQEKKTTTAKNRRRDPIEQALRLDAACVMIKFDSMSRVSSAVRPERASLLRFKDACDRFGMPVMIEIPSFPDGSLNTVERNLLLVKHAVDLGADVIRTNIPLGLDGYRRILEAAEGVPLVASANEIAAPGLIVKWAEAVISQGVNGILLGSAMLESTRATSLMRSLREIVHCEAEAPRAGRKALRSRKVSSAEPRVSIGPRRETIPHGREN